MLAFTLVVAGHFGWLPVGEVPKLAVDSARRAVELDDNDPWAYLSLGYVACVQRRTDDAAALFRRAIALNPNFAAAYAYLGLTFAFDGRLDEATTNVGIAIRMSPHDRQNIIGVASRAVANYLAKRYDDAIGEAQKLTEQAPNWAPAHRILCASLAQAGRLEEARAVLARIRELQPEISIAWVERMVPYTPTQMPHFLEGMRKAGLT